jgi:hypothetical protein
MLPVRPALGKYYINRRGDVHGPMTHSNWKLQGFPNSLPGWSVPSDCDKWYEDGCYLWQMPSHLKIGKKNYCEFDLVEEIDKEDIPSGTFVFN